MISGAMRGENSGALPSPSTEALTPTMPLRTQTDTHASVKGAFAVTIMLCESKLKVIFKIG